MCVCVFDFMKLEEINSSPNEIPIELKESFVIHLPANLAEPTCIQTYYILQCFILLSSDIGQHFKLVYLATAATISFQSGIPFGAQQVLLQYPFTELVEFLGL